MRHLLDPLLTSVANGRILHRLPPGGEALHQQKRIHWIGDERVRARGSGQVEALIVECPTAQLGQP